MKKPHKNNIKSNVGGKKKRNRGTGYLTQAPTKRELRHESKVDAGLKWNPTIRQERKDIQASRQRQGDITRQYGQLGDTISQEAGATDASYAAANAAMLANLEASARNSSASQGQINQANAQFAQLTGADPTNFQAGMQSRASAADQRSLTQAALAAPIAQAGANQAAFLRNVGVNARHEGIYQRGQERKRQQAIKGDLMTARKERGGEAGSLFGQKKQTAIENQTKREAFNLERKGASAEAAQDAREARQRREENREDNAQDERGSQRSAHSGGGKNGLTPSQRRDARREQHNAMTAATTLYNAAGQPQWSDKQWTVFVQRVAMEDGIDYTAAKRAVNRLRKRAGGGSLGKDPNGASLGR